MTEVAGTTRDAIDARMTVGEGEGAREIVLVDTAGLRRKAKVKENVEFYSALRTELALQSCDVAVVLVDAERGLEAQDARVLREAEQLKKGMLIVVNKWGPGGGQGDEHGARHRARDARAPGAFGLRAGPVRLRADRPAR